MEDPRRPYWLRAEEIVLALREKGEAQPDLLPLADKLEELLIETKVMPFRAHPFVTVKVEDLPDDLREAFLRALHAP